MIVVVLYLGGAAMLAVGALSLASALHFSAPFLVFQETEIIALFAAGLLCLGLARLISEVSLTNATLAAIRERLQMDANRRG